LQSLSAQRVRSHWRIMTPSLLLPTPISRNVRVSSGIQLHAGQVVQSRAAVGWRTAVRQGVKVVNQRLKQLMKELSEAINESLSEAEPIAAVIGKIKGEGYDVFLVLEATVGFNRHEEEESKPELVRGNKASSVAPELKVNAQDLRFLKSLRISLSESQSKDVKDRAA